MRVQSNMSWPAARIVGASLDAIDGAIQRHEARGVVLLVFTAGPVPYFYGRYPTGPVDASAL